MKSSRALKLARQEDQDKDSAVYYGSDSGKKQLQGAEEMVVDRSGKFVPKQKKEE